MDSTNSTSVDRKLELHIQRDLVTFLHGRGWHVERMLANSFQMGIPDLFCYHKKWGMRWVEVKRPEGYSFTLRQRQKWPEWEKASIGIWILTAATQEQYDLLFKAPNWRDFWRPSFAVPTRADVDIMLDELDHEEEQSRASKQLQVSNQSEVPDKSGASDQSQIPGQSQASSHSEHQ